MTLIYSQLQSFEGIGNKVAEKLIKYFGGEEEAVDAIKHAKVSEIASIRGISLKKAFKIVNDYREKEIGISLNEILRSNEIKRIYKAILDLASSYANTSQGKDAISLHFPLPRSKIHLIKERIAYFTDAKKCIDALDSKSINEIKFLLSKARPLKVSGSLINRKKLILTDDQEDYENLLEEELTRSCDIQIMDKKKVDIEYFQDISQSYDLVFIISSNSLPLLDQFENFIKLDELDIIRLVPENSLNVFALNKLTIKATRELCKKIMRLDPNESVKTFQVSGDLEILNEINDFLDMVNQDGSLKGDISAEIFKFKQNLTEFDNYINTIEFDINQSITDQINKLEIKLSGNQILDILKVGSGLDENELDVRKYLPEEISELIHNELKKVVDKILANYDLRKDDETLVLKLFENESSALPIELNGLEANKLKKLLEKRYFMKEHAILYEQAKNIQKYERKFREIVQKIFKFDEFFAIGLFSKDYSLTPPDLLENDLGISFKDGFNLFLKQNELESDDFEAESVDYQVGNGPHFPLNERTIILSGANSGGKTCLLQTIAHVSIMAQMGLLVPAAEGKCAVSVFDELYYYEKSSGMLNSGAFEASLKQFNYTCMSNKIKLVLFDELEAITEPGSATKIIARLLEILDESKNTISCLVSHLADQIKSAIQIPIRIDGIEASGIKDGKLIVNRNPRFNYLAKSMPYLIIEKLILQSEDKEKKIYEKLMKNLQ